MKRTSTKTDFTNCYWTYKSSPQFNIHKNTNRFNPKGG